MLAGGSSRGGVCARCNARRPKRQWKVRSEPEQGGSFTVRIRLARVFGTLLAVSVLIGLGSSAALAQESPRLESVIVALQELGGAESQQSGALDRLASTLEQGGIKVLERIPLGDASVERGEGSESALRERARKAGADAVVLARIAQVGQSTNLDLRVLPA